MLLLTLQVLSTSSMSQYVYYSPHYYFCTLFILNLYYSRTVTVAWGRRQHKVSIPERATTADLCCALRELTSKDMFALVLKPHGGRGYVRILILISTAVI